MAITLDQVRRVNWGRTYLWEAWFPAIDFDPFVGWFPATSVDLPWGGVDKSSIAVGPYEISIPMGFKVSDMSVTFLDDHRGSLFNWIKDWQYEIAPQGYNGFKALNQVIRKFHFKRLDLDKRVIEINAFDVFPVGELRDTWDSESGSKSFSVTFAVAGRLIGG